jgi:O-antigen ligase
MDWGTADSHRVAQFGTTWRVLQVHPFFGVGFGNFTRLFDLYNEPTTPPSYVVTVDNMYLMTLCEIGALGLAAFLTMLMVIGLVLRHRLRQFMVGSDWLFLRASLAAFAGFLVNMIGWDALNHPAVRITFWIIIGLALAAVQCCVNPDSQQESAQ